MRVAVQKVFENTESRTLCFFLLGALLNLQTANRRGRTALPSPLQWYATGTTHVTSVLPTIFHPPNCQDVLCKFVNEILLANWREINYKRTKRDARFWPVWTCPNFNEPSVTLYHQLLCMRWEKFLINQKVIKTCLCSLPVGFSFLAGD